MSSKKKRSKNGITLLSLMIATVLLIAGYVFYTNHKEKVEGEKAAAEAAKEAAKNATFVINEEEASNFTSIAIQGLEDSMTFVLSDGVWVLQGEEEFPTDQDKIDSMASTLSKLSASKTVTEAASDLSEYGLAQPSIVVTATREDNSQLVLNIGDKLSVDSDYYGSLNDSTTVYVIPLATRTKFNVVRDDVFALAQTPSVTLDQLLEIQLSTKSEGSFHIAYDAENPYDYTGTGTYTWYSVGDNRLPVNVDNMTISTLLSNFLSFSLDKGVSYGVDAMKEYGLDNPEGMIYVRYADSDDATKENEFILYIGNKDADGNYYVSVNDEEIVYLMLADDLTDKLAYQEADILTSFTHLVNIKDVSHLDITTPLLAQAYTFETEVTTDSQGNESTVTTYKKDGEVIEDEESFKDFYQSVISLKRSGNLTYDDKVSGDPVLTIDFNLTNDHEIKVCYYNFSDSSYAVEINGNVQYTADKTEIDTFIQSLN